MSFNFLICALVTLASALTSLGFYIAAYLQSDKTSRINAMYAISRSIAIIAICFVPFINNSSSWLVATATTMIIVQILDALIGIKINNTLKTFGPAITAAVNLLALIWFVRKLQQQYIRPSI